MDYLTTYKLYILTITIYKLYTIGMEVKFSKPKAILPYIKGKLDDFYLAGGTALSMYYFEHRESEDLDFFTKSYSQDRVIKIIDGLKKDTNWSIDLKREQNQKGLIAMSSYNIQVNKELDCKIDFVEDYLDLIAPLKRVEDINIMSLEDIYLRKIFAIAGHMSAVNEVGQKIIKGGRQEAKDLYDIYCLSTITLPLAEFIPRYCDHTIIEGVIIWFETYDRMEMKSGLLDLETKTRPDYRLIDGHIKKEIDKLKEMIIGE